MDRRAVEDLLARRRAVVLPDIHAVAARRLGHRPARTRALAGSDGRGGWWWWWWEHRGWRGPCQPRDVAQHLRRRFGGEVEHRGAAAGLGDEQAVARGILCGTHRQSRSSPRVTDERAAGARGDGCGRTGKASRKPRLCSVSSTLWTGASPLRMGRKALSGSYAGRGVATDAGSASSNAEVRRAGSGIAGC